MVKYSAALILALCLMRSAGAENLLSHLRVEQPVVQKKFEYEAGRDIRISFDLSRPADVSVAIDRHLATIGGDAHGNPPGSVGQYYYVPEPLPVRTLALGRLQAGRQTVVWDGQNEDGTPVVETQVYPYKELARDQKVPENLLLDVPVNHFRITVSAGGETVAANFERATGMVLASREVRNFTGAVFDNNGKVLVSARRDWRGRRYSLAWRLEQEFPADPRGHSSNPIHCYDAAVDSKGNLYLASSPGIYRYDSEGNPLAFEHKADYINAQYPISIRNMLGYRFNRDKENGTQKFLFGNGRVEWNVSEKIEEPGFVFDWGGLAIDEEDNVYVGEAAPRQRILVFAPSGEYQRSLPLPEGRKPRYLRIAPTGKLWITTDRGIYIVDRNTGKEIQHLQADGRLHRGADDRMYVYNRSRVIRFSSEGDKLPFDEESPYVKDEGDLDLNPNAGAPEQALGYANHVFCVVAAPDGDLFISAGNSSHPWRNTDMRMLHFSKEGYFLPDVLSAVLEQHRPGNLFIDDEPARFELYVNNLSEQNKQINAEWTITDFYGKKTSGSARYVTAEQARQSLPLIVSAPEYGHYRMNVKLSSGGRAVASLDTQFARVRSREMKKDPDTHFAVNWGVNFYMMAHCGAKTAGSPSIWWHKMEPIEGLQLKWPQENIQWSQGVEGYRAYADRWGVSVGEGFSYGEPWFGIPNHRIYSYDKFFNFCLRVMDRFEGRGVDDYGFWNEPNFFWHVPGEFRAEHFALVGKHTWSIVKARDKNALAVMDGDSGSNKMMASVAAAGGNLYNDTVQIHYPGTEPLAFDEIVISRSPESKVGMMRELVALRDKQFPGKPIWNTEEGWWGAKEKSLEIGARVIPRVYIPQIAVGADRIWWYQQGRGGEYDPTNLLGPDNLPYASYVSFATMTQHLTGAEFVDRVYLGDPELYAYLFTRGNQAILTAWRIEGEQQVELPLGTQQVTVADLMDRRRDVETPGGTLKIMLDENAQYITMPNTRWTERVAKKPLKGLDHNITVTPQLIAETAPQAATDPRMMNRLYHLVQESRQIALAGLGPKTGDLEAVAKARKEIETKEGPDGYLRQARLVLSWAERLARSSRRLSGETGAQMAEPAEQAANAAMAVAAAENVIYPGCVINAYLEPDKVRVGADPDQPLDEKFKFEISKKAGDQFQLELTVWNYYRHGFDGTVQPRLPQGWHCRPSSEGYSVKPGTFERFVFIVTIPAECEAGLYQVGGTTTYNGATVHEIHRQRVQVTR